MNNNHIYAVMAAKAMAVAATLALSVSCASLGNGSSHAARRYMVADVSRSRILIDSRYDAAPDADAAAFLQPYKARVDSLMSPIMGTAACDMSRQRPEGTLSNLLADILVWGGRRSGEHPDFGVYNMGGIRASISRGTVTRGDILDVAPFENHLCLLTLTGDDVLELLKQIASVGGEAVSHEVRLVISPDGRLLEASVGGQPVDTARTYRIATLDYLAQGNDHLEAFKLKRDVVSPDGDANNVRFLIEDYFKDAAAKGESVTSKIEGRITVADGDGQDVR